MNKSEFLVVYTQETVDGFFKRLEKESAKADDVAKFCKYHTKEILIKWVEELWPPPSLEEIWRRWKALPLNKRDVYEPFQPPRCKSDIYIME
jgi:hypothetical protein